MKTANFSIKTVQDKQSVLKHIQQRECEFTVSIVDGLARTNPQNRLQRLWLQELAEQSKEHGITAEEWRAYIKLHIGVPLLREQNEAFRIGYDKTVKPLPYETKMQLMQEPTSLPVTSLMTVKQKKEFLDRAHRELSAQGYVLTDPNWQGWDNIN